MRRLATVWRKVKAVAGWVFGEIIYPLWVTFRPSGATVAPEEKKGGES